MSVSWGEYLQYLEEEKKEEMLEDKKEEMLSKSNYLWLRGWQPAETEGWCWPGTGILLDKFIFKNCECLLAIS